MLTEKQVTQFREQGFVVIDGFSKELFDPLRKAAERTVAKGRTGQWKAVRNAPNGDIWGGAAEGVTSATGGSKRDAGRTLYMIDELTTGLHFEDVRVLLHVLHRLVDRGNTVLVIEHNLDVIKTADWIVDLGPEGGTRGGTIVATGTPEDVARVEASHTGRYLRNMLGPPATADTRNSDRRREAPQEGAITTRRKAG